MNFLSRFFLQALFFFAVHSSLAIHPKAGFFLPDNVPEVTFKFQQVGNLILLPVILNDSVTINLILDTGCRNIILFGKRFQKLLVTDPDRKIQFSGLGDGKPVNGKLSLNNKVSIHAVIGEKIPVVIVESQNLFGAYSNIHGVIGYDIFIKFEIELNPRRQLITFRPAAGAELSSDYLKIPLQIEDSRPLIHSRVFFSAHDDQGFDLMLDTGSSLGLLLKTTDLKKYPKRSSKKILGKGLNGDIVGSERLTKKLVLDTFEIEGVLANVTYSPWHNHASVGMDILKNYSIVLNYCKAYAGFKKV